MRQHTVDGVQLDCAFCQLFLRLAKTFLNVAPDRAEGGNDEFPKSRGKFEIDRLQQTDFRADNIRPFSRR